MSFSLTTVFLQNKRDFILRDSLLSEIRANQQLEYLWSPSVHLSRGSEHLACTANFCFTFGPVPRCFAFHTHSTNQQLWLFREMHFSISIGDQWRVPYGQLWNLICKCAFVKWGIHQEFGAVTRCFKFCIWVLLSWKIKFVQLPMRATLEALDPVSEQKLGTAYKSIEETEGMPHCDITLACFPAQTKKSMIVFRSHADNGNDLCCRRTQFYRILKGTEELCG